MDPEPLRPEEARREAQVSPRPTGMCLIVVLGTVATGCGNPPSPETESPVGYHMYDRMARTAALQQAVLAGDLEAARAPARWLDTHNDTEILGGDAEVYVARMRVTAGQISSARTVEEAARYLGEMGTACGACHQSAGIPVDFRWLPLPPASGEIDAHMVRHRWAVDRLWEGLVGPSEEAWDAGAKALAQPSLHITRTTAEAGRRHRAEAGDALVQRLGVLATEDGGAEERAELFSEVVGACHDCHELLQVSTAR